MTSRERRIQSLKSRPHTAAGRVTGSHQRSSDDEGSAGGGGVQVHNHSLALELLGLAPAPAASGAGDAGSQADILVVHGDGPGDDTASDGGVSGGSGAALWPASLPAPAPSPRIGSGLGRPVGEQVAMMRPRTATSRHRSAANTRPHTAVLLRRPGTALPGSGLRGPPRPPTSSGWRGAGMAPPPLPPASTRGLPPRLHSPLLDTGAGQGGLGMGVARGSDALLGIMRANETAAATSLLMAAEKGDLKAVQKALAEGLCDVNERSGLVRMLASTTRLLCSLEFLS